MEDVRQRCPLCGGDNQCGFVEQRAGGKQTSQPVRCWCFDQAFDVDLQQSLPEERSGRCICRACANSLSQS